MTMLSIPSLYRIFLIRDLATDDVLVELPLVAETVSKRLDVIN